MSSQTPLANSQCYEPQWDRSKYRKVMKLPRTKIETFRSCGQRDPEWEIPSEINITVELDPNQPPTIREIIGTRDLLMPAILQEREQQRLKWEAERADAAKPKSLPETKPEEPTPPKGWFARICDWLKSNPSS